MYYRGLLEDLKNIIPTIVLDSLANLYKNKILPSFKDVNTLRKDVLDLGVCMSETEGVVNHNADLLNEELISIAKQDKHVADVLNNHAELLKSLIADVNKLKRDKKS